ncbi:MAG: 5-formyltetrahydrofolate cyclo-ligase [Candidatus Cyclobacteriaceae bacterium M3_2C_046]
MNKQRLRKQFLERRKAYSDQEIDQKSMDIKDQLVNHFNLDQVSYIHTFLPILKQKEINTWPIIHYIREAHPRIKLVVSKSDTQSNQMIHFHLTPHTKLLENKWGIPEPVDGIICKEDSIDMILIPLVVADRLGNRIGYGKGYYDEFLNNCRPDSVKAGLCLEEPIELIEDVHDRDIRLNHLVTPGQVYIF